MKLSTFTGTSVVFGAERKVAFVIPYEPGPNPGEGHLTITGLTIGQAEQVLERLAETRPSLVPAALEPLLTPEQEEAQMQRAFDKWLGGGMSGYGAPISGKDWLEKEKAREEEAKSTFVPPPRLMSESKTEPEPQSMEELEGRAIAAQEETTPSDQDPPVSDELRVCGSVSAVLRTLIGMGVETAEALTAYCLKHQTEIPAIAKVKDLKAKLEKHLQVSATAG